MASTYFLGYIFSMMFYRKLKMQVYNKWKTESQATYYNKYCWGNTVFHI